MPLSTPLLAAAAAIGAAWLLERAADAPSLTSIAPTRAAGMDTALQSAASRALPCGVARLSDVRTLFGAPIRTLPGGAGEDFIREFLIQRSSLTRALGDIGIPGITDRPKLSARCAELWLELWLDAFEVANHASPKAFAVSKRPTVRQTGLFGIEVTFDPVDWRSFDVDEPTALGRAVDAARTLRAFATAETVVGLGDLRPWIRARSVTEALLDLARELDAVGFQFDVGAEAIEALRRDLHPIRFVEKAADVVVAPVEVALEKAVGPTLGAIVGTLVVSLAPLLVIGGAAYLIAKRGGL
jgi:hypothetical protein